MTLSYSFEEKECLSSITRIMVKLNNIWFNMGNRQNGPTNLILTSVEEIKASRFKISVLVLLLLLVCVTFSSDGLICIFVAFVNNSTRVFRYCT